MFMLLAGVLAVVPVEDAVPAESSGYGPDGYFSKLSDGARPVVDNETGTPNSPAANGDTNTRGIMFGETNASSTNDNRTLTGIYKTLAKGPVDTEVLSFQPATTGNWHKSSTTTVLEGEALLWADEVVTKNFDYSSRNTFDFSASSKSTIATKSSDVGKNNYSSFEKQQLRNDPVEGVCTVSSCRSGSESNSPANSKGSYLVFPLSSGDMNKYLNHTANHDSGDANLKCRGSLGTTCGPSESGPSLVGYWLRSPNWNNEEQVIAVGNSKVGAMTVTSSDGYGLRPALRLRLDNLLLSGNKGNQGQSVSGDLRLTFVDTAANVVLSKTPRLEKNGANWELTDVDGTVNGFTKTGFGWKLIDPEDDSGEVVASGRTNKDAATNTDGNMVVPCASLMPGKDYTLSVWGQRDGSATAGWSNRATVPVSGMVVRADGSGGCA
ncbi:hypothetical protein, partial [Bifidobacterium crudilactis]